MKNIITKAVKVTELKVGQLYVDGMRKDKSKMCVFEFVEHDEEGDPYFKYISGYNPYSSSSKGLFGFSTSSEDWYEIESFEEQD
jgi:hypothetical protein